MQAYNYRHQFRAVLITELVMMGFYVIFLFLFWDRMCEGSLSQCLGKTESLQPLNFLLLSFIRPFILTPISFFTVLAGKAFGTYLGTALTVLGAFFSTISLFMISKYLGNRIVRPWFHANLPQTYKFIRSQDLKIALFCRLVPFFHFDLLTLIFGAANFSFRAVALSALIGSLPEALILTQISADEGNGPGMLKVVILILTVIAALTGIYEYTRRRKGFSLWQRFRAMWAELEFEVKRNNDVIKRYHYEENKIPVLLLYGFFSSRRALTVLEKQLVARNYNVISFNLGGLLGVFFTKSIIDSAKFLEYKLNRQFTRHNFHKIRIVAHSKGGFVALWWLLKLSGNKHCDKLICMGTPFKGSPYTYIALMTPLGFFWKDMWQMRPGSSMLRYLTQLPIPENTDIYCLYSDTDRVAGGERGIFQASDPHKKVKNIKLEEISHFEFLYKRHVADTIMNLLGSPYQSDPDLGDIPRTPVDEQEQSVNSFTQATVQDAGATVAVEGNASSPQLEETSTPETTDDHDQGTNSETDGKKTANF